MKESTKRVSEELRTIARGLDERIEGVAGERVAFTLVVFTEGRASYISTCGREASQEGLRMILAQWDAGVPAVEAHRIN